jgi:hypothetical protein
MRVTTALTLYCGINRLEYYLSTGERDHAVTALERLYKDGGISSLEPSMLASIRDSLFLVQLYIMCEADSCVDQELSNIKKQLSAHVMSRELMRMRLEDKGDIGSLSHLPELCLQKITHLLYNVC